MNICWERKCDEVDRLIGESKPRQAWKTMRTLKTSSREVKSINAIGMDSCKRYYECLLIEDRYNFREVDYTNEPVNHVVRKVTVKEVREAIKAIKNNKTVGPGSMPTELITNSPTVTLELIAMLFTSCLQDTEVPEEWKFSYVGFVSKKSSKRKCANYRESSSISSMCRLYGRIVKSRTEEQVKDCGFRPGRSAIGRHY
ncbi:hypothetical protein Trydic_g16750 [Trypoxylus dichotomus]